MQLDKNVKKKKIKKVIKNIKNEFRGNMTV